MDGDHGDHGEASGGEDELADGPPAGGRWDPTDPPPSLPPPPGGPRNPWAIAGIVLAIVLGLVGLAIVGAVVLFFVALSNWGSNK